MAYKPKFIHLEKRLNCFTFDIFVLEVIPLKYDVSQLPGADAKLLLIEHEKLVLG
jgi:hypothetical protein